MAKPVSGATLDSGHALYSALTAADSAVWALLEGSGGTSADSSGNGRTLTLDGSVSWTTIGGEAALALAGVTTAYALAVDSAPAVAGTSSWSFAFRFKTTSPFSNGIVAAKGDFASYIMARDGNYLRFTAGGSGTNYNFTSGPTDFTADHNYLLVYDQPNANLHLYVDGSEAGGSPISITGNDAAFTVSNLGGDYGPGGTFGLIGTLTYAYLMAGYAADSADAAGLHSDPYAIFSAGGGGVLAGAIYHTMLSGGNPLA